MAFASPVRADPPDRQQCAHAYESAQRLRRAHALRGARESLLVCSHAECPGWVKKECTPWLAEVEEALPTIIVTARDDAGPRTDVRVKVDGEVVAEKISNDPIAIDPGTHTISFEAPGAKRVEQRITLAEHEHDRRLEIDLVGGKTQEPKAPPKPEKPTDPEEPTPVLTYVFGSVGAVTLGFGMYFQLSGMSQRSALDACAPSCSAGQVDDARRSLWAGNILLGVSVVAIAAAVYFYVARPAVTTAR
jgi:hypothetical protein